MKKAKDFFARYRNILLTWSLTCGIVASACAFSWKHFAVPDIERRIETRMNPVFDAIEFQNYMWMEYLPDSVVTRATKKYTQMKEHSCKK